MKKKINNPIEGKPKSAPVKVKSTFNEKTKKIDAKKALDKDNNKDKDKR